MNKKLLALAVAGAFAAPAAMADTSNVTIYGVINMSVDSVDGGSYNTTTGLNAATAERRTRISSNNSNLGFKGTEDLGNGLSAIWQFETAVGWDTNGLVGNANTTTGAIGASSDSIGTIGQRNTFAGFSSKTMGALTFGNQESPMKTSISKLDMFANTIADYRTLIGPQVRMASSALYASPNMSGFDFKVGYSARNEAGNDSTTGSLSDPSYWSANLTYANGPILAAVAHEVEKAVTTITANTKQTTSRAGFGYNFGVAKVGLGWNTTKLNSTSTAAVGSSEKVNSWLLSGAYNLGKTTLKAQYVKSSDTKGNTISSEGAKQWTLGADYSLSKRTNLYALYTVLKNDTNSGRTLGGNTGLLGGSTGVATVSAAATGQDPKAISVGFVHSF